MFSNGQSNHSIKWLSKQNDNGAVTTKNASNWNTYCPEIWNKECKIKPGWLQIVLDFTQLQLLSKGFAYAIVEEVQVDASELWCLMGTSQLGYLVGQPFLPSSLVRNGKSSNQKSFEKRRVISGKNSKTDPPNGKLPGHRCPKHSNS